MDARLRDETGETLLEIVLSLVIIGLVVGAFLAAYTTATTGSTAHRDLVTADAVLRDYAELTKSAVRASCPSSSTYTVSSLDLQPPSGFTPSPTPGTSQSCPTSATVVKQVDLGVTMPNGKTKLLSVDVRTP